MSSPRDVTQPRMKSQAEIQRAHDILHFLGTHRGTGLFAEPEAVDAAHDALAWVLGFPCGEALDDNLSTAVAYLRVLGFVEVGFGRPLSPEEQKSRKID